MLYVKHITISGEERIYLAEGTFYSPEIKEPFASSAHRAAGFSIVNRDHDTELHGGTIFVMNENGKTIQRYDLGASPVPL